MSDTRLILHLKGTESQTTELPKNVVRAGIAQGQITRSQLIWSKAHNAWKQVRELPHLLPSQKLAPAPAPRVGTVALPKSAQKPPDAKGGVPKIVPKVSVAGAEPVKVKAMAAKPKVKTADEDHLVIEQESFLPYMKWVCAGLTVVILALIGMNYFKFTRPLASGMSQTAYAKVSVYAHLGAFVQPGALVIHVANSPAVTSDNLADFLQTLARNTPSSPSGGDVFDNVSLTTGWTAHYSFNGGAWRSFGDMADVDSAQKRDFLLNSLLDSSGEALLSPSGNLQPDAAQVERDKVWADFVAYFTR